MTGISTAFKSSLTFKSGQIGLIFAAATILSAGVFAGSAEAGASQAGMAAAQAAVRDARDQVQRRQWAQHRSHQWYR
jgi:hypothetical protein